MTALSIIQDASVNIGIERPTDFFGQSDRELQELQEIINACAKKIALAHDWQLLTTIVAGSDIPTGDGSTEGFALPSDFSRMDDSTQVWSTTDNGPMVHIKDRDVWLGMDVQDFDTVTSSWTLYGNQIHIKPAMATGETAKYWYTSNLIVTDAAMATKVAFTADTDVFRLDEELLKLCVIYQWKEKKRQTYQAEMEAYETRLAALMSTDKGARTVRVGRNRTTMGARTAYPYTITP